MLNPVHPLTPHRFAALHQLGLVQKFANHITLATGRSRRDFYDIIKPAIVALHWINETQFGNREELRDTITALDRELCELADKPHEDRYVDNRKHCPTCGAAITEYGTFQPHGVSFTVPEFRYCEPCLERFYHLLEKLKSASAGFGLEAI